MKRASGITSLFDRFRTLVRELRTANGANVTITFAVATIPMIGFVGAAVDYSRANSVKAAMQAAVDSTALMLSKQAASLNPSDIQPKAEAYFKALLNRPEANGVTVETPGYTPGVSKILVTAKASVKTDFMGVFGVLLGSNFSQMDIGVESMAKWGSTKLRVALVLDNTGSMSSAGKMTALKTATNNLLDQLKSAAATDGDVYVSIIPFVKDVNAGASNYASSWINWAEWEDEPPILDTAQGGSKPSNWYSIGPGSSCPFSSSSHGFQCTNGPATSGASATSSIPSSGNHRGLICPGLDNGNRRPLKDGVYYNGCYNSWTSCIGSNCACTTTNTSICKCTGSGLTKTCTTSSGYYDHTWRPTLNNAVYTPLLSSLSSVPYATPARSTWNGCVVDRGNISAPNSGNYDTNVAAPTTSNTATLFAAEQYYYCPRAVMPLTYDWTALKNLVNNMSPAGNTNQGIGLAHGWMSLVGGGPYPTPPSEDPNYKYSKVIILMTDGLNTQNRWYTSQTSIDNRQKITCNNVKAAGITLYTIQVNTDGDPTSTMLQNCASSPDKFFLLKSASQMVTAFQQIGTALSNLRIAQ